MEERIEEFLQGAVVQFPVGLPVQFVSGGEDIFFAVLLSGHTIREEPPEQTIVPLI